MPANTQEWMAYIDGEVRAVCETLGWGHQIRRRWSVRERAVSQSTIDDYEWKLIPEARGRLPEAQSHDFDGVYYVLRFDEAERKFVLQHDTTHVSYAGPDWEEATYTDIRTDYCLLRQAHLERVESPGHSSTGWLQRLWQALRPERAAASPGHPPVGWLRDHLLRLVARFGPNSFSTT